MDDPERRLEALLAAVKLHGPYGADLSPLQLTDKVIATAFRFDRYIETGKSSDGGTPRD